MKNLKEDIYYSDLYDRHTVKICREVEVETKAKYAAKVAAAKDEDKKYVSGAVWIVNHFELYSTKGQRFKNKEETIWKWKNADRLRDELLEKAVAPQGVCCLACGRHMVSDEGLSSSRGDADCVLFFYTCPNNHFPKRAFYDDGQEYIPKPIQCPKCQGKMTSDEQTKDNISTTTDTCTQCGHIETSTYTFSPDISTDTNYEEDRRKFCLSDEEGKEYIDFSESTRRFAEERKEREEKEKNKELYEAVAKIRKLPVGEIQKLLIPAFEEGGYLNLHFQPPEMNRDVAVPFSAIDNKGDRTEQASTDELKALIDTILQGTNWKLMAEGISYRVGYLSGRLRCLEREDDLLNLVKKTLTHKTETPTHV